MYDCICINHEGQCRYQFSISGIGKLLVTAKNARFSNYVHCLVFQFLKNLLDTFLVLAILGRYSV